MKPLGNFEEMDIRPAVGSIKEVIGKLDDRERRLAGIYLLEASRIVYTMGLVPDVLDGEYVPLAASLRTDGEWFWRSDLAHYVLKYGVGLPAAFLEHAAANRWLPPWFSDDELEAISRQMRSEGW